MKTCVVTANYSCDPNKVWLYLTKPTLNHWRSDVSEYEESDDGLKGVEHNTDGGTTEIVFTRKDKARHLGYLPQRQDQRHLYRHPDGRRRLYQFGVHAGRGRPWPVLQAPEAAG